MFNLELECLYEYGFKKIDNSSKRSGRTNKSRNAVL